MPDLTPAATSIRQAVEAVFAISPAPPTTEDVAAAVLRAAAETLLPEELEPIEPIPLTYAKAINYASDWAAWHAMTAANERLQALAAELEGIDD